MSSSAVTGIGVNILFDFLGKLKGIGFKYVPNPGNAGDSLIAYSTLNIFNQLGLKYSIHAHTEHFKADDILVYGGGGNFVPPYADLRRFLINNLHASNILVLPHTIRGNEDILSLLGNNVILFARERVSFRHIVNHMKHPENAFMTHDMAFHISGLQEFKSIQGKGVLNAFRLDCERTSIGIPSDNIDLSVKCMVPNNTSCPTAIKESTRRVFEAIANASTIKTNRLHVAIASSLLGRETLMYPNSYFKNKAVFEYSLFQHFDCVQFMG